MKKRGGGLNGTVTGYDAFWLRRQGRIKIPGLAMAKPGTTNIKDQIMLIT